MDQLTVSTTRRQEFREITASVSELLARSGVRRGLCHVFTTHTTCALTINENADPDVPADIIAGLERLAPEEAGYAHAEGNAAAHIKSSLLGCALSVPVDAGRLCLGTWQGIFLCEFDGPRRRRVLVSFAGDR